MIGDWAAMRDREGLILNYYGPSSIAVEVQPGQTVTLIQETDYPRSGQVVLRLDMEGEQRFVLKLRIPYWSARTEVSLNGQPVSGAKPGRYLSLDWAWRAGDTIALDLDTSFHYWAGERECAGRTSIYRGPVLLAYDHRYNLARTAGRPTEVRQNAEWNPGQDALFDAPHLDAREMDAAGRLVEWDGWLPPWMLFRFEAAEGGDVYLCDYGSAGEAGTPYRTWLPVDHAPGPFAFSRDNPLRSGRADS
jgi:hypothetical protein